MNKKNIYLYLYLGSWTLLVLIWLKYLIKIINSNINYDDTRVGFVVPLMGISLLLSFIPSVYILFSSYWYLKKWRTCKNFIYVISCILMIVFSHIWSSKHISSSIEKNERLYVPPQVYQLNEDDKWICVLCSLGANYDSEMLIFKVRDACWIILNFD